MSSIIERRHEVQNVLELWERIRQGNTKTTFREFYGIPGIGKTELARQIENALDSRGALCARLDFDPIQNPWGNTPTNEEIREYYDKPEKLFEDLLMEWDYLGSVNLREKLSYYCEASSLKPRRFAQEVVERVETLPPDKTAVLICDETDHIKWNQIPWFENCLIVPLVRSERCLVIWLGRREKQWSVESSGIKGRVKSSILEPFSPSDLDVRLKLAEIRLDKKREDELLNWLYDITQGHPMAVKVAIHHYSQASAKGMNYEESRGLVKAIAERVIKGYVLRDNSLPFSKALRLSLLRINDVLLLRALVGNPSDSLFSYGRLSNELRANPLGDFGNRLLKKSIATWLHRYFRLFDPENYLEKQEALVEGCKRLCNSKHKDNWSTYVVEGIYHATCANTVTDKYDLLDILKGHLESLQSSEMARYSEALVMELRESLVRDKEIEEYIGKDGVDRLIAVLE